MLSAPVDHHALGSFGWQCSVHSVTVGELNQFMPQLSQLVEFPEQLNIFINSQTNQLNLCTQSTQPSETPIIKYQSSHHFNRQIWLFSVTTRAKFKCQQKTRQYATQSRGWTSGGGEHQIGHRLVVGLLDCCGGGSVLHSLRFKLYCLPKQPFSTFTHRLNATWWYTVSV